MENKIKSQDGAIYSGHLMISNVNGYESDDEASSETISESDEKKDIVDLDYKIGNNLIATKPNELILNFHKKLATDFYTAMPSKPFIDDSLSRLFECLTLAYNEKPTSPRWNWFKGLKMRIKDKLRLNNVIWRAWHMQFMFKIKPPICQFEVTLDEKIPEIIILEGSYWKRRLDTVIAEYRKWRITMRNKNLKHHEKRTFKLTHKLPNILKAPQTFHYHDHSIEMCNNSRDGCLNFHPYPGLGIDEPDFDNHSTSTLIANDLLDLIESHNRSGEYALDLKANSFIPGSPDYFDTLNDCYLTFDNIVDELLKSPGLLELNDHGSSANYLFDVAPTSSTTFDVTSPESALFPTSTNNNQISIPESGDISISNTPSSCTKRFKYDSSAISAFSSNITHISTSLPSQGTASNNINNSNCANRNSSLSSRNFIQPGLSKLRPNLGLSYLETVGSLDEIVKNTKRSYQHLITTEGTGLTGLPLTQGDDNRRLENTSGSKLGPNMDSSQICGPPGALATTNPSYTSPFIISLPHRDMSTFNLSNYAALQSSSGDAFDSSNLDVSIDSAFASSCSASSLDASVRAPQMFQQQTSQTSQTYFTNNSSFNFIPPGSDINSPPIIVINNPYLQNQIGAFSNNLNLATLQHSNGASPFVTNLLQNQGVNPLMIPSPQILIINNGTSSNPFLNNLSQLNIAVTGSLTMPPPASMGSTPSHFSTFSSNYRRIAPAPISSSAPQYLIFNTPSTNYCASSANVSGTTHNTVDSFARQSARSNIAPFLNLNFGTSPGQPVIFESCDSSTTPNFQSDDQTKNNRSDYRASNSKFSNTSNLSDDEMRSDWKRHVHITSEHRRRCSIKQGFENLIHLVPCLATQNPLKISQIATLSHTFEYTKHLRRKILENNTHFDEIKSDIANLSREISHFQGSLTELESTASRTSLNINVPNYVRFSRTNQIGLFSSSSDQSPSLPTASSSNWSQLNSSDTLLDDTITSLGIPTLPTGVRPLLTFKDYVKFERAACSNDFKTYIDTKINQNWKYRIFSAIFDPLFQTFNQCVNTTSITTLCESVIKWLDDYFHLNQLRPAVLAILVDLSTKTSILNVQTTTAAAEILKKYQPS